MELNKNVLRPSSPLFNNFIRSLLRYPLFRISGLYTGRKISSNLSKIYNFYSSNNNFQERKIKEKLLKILKEAKKSKFYKEKISDEIIDKISIDMKFINDLPVTTKEDLLDAPENFFTKECDIGKLIRSNTNGSTGPSAAIFYDQYASDASSSVTWFCRSFYEKFYKNTTLHLAADLAENSKALPAMVDWARFFSTNRFNIFISSLEDQSTELYLKNILKRKYQLIHSHPSTLYHLALYAIEKNIKVDNCFNIFESSGEKLFDFQKQIISEDFKCKIIDRYGFAETGIVAYQLPFFKNFLTIMRHHCFIENSKNNNDNLIITNFNNNIFPLIRYKNGDKITTEDSSIPRYIKEIKGREHSIQKFGGKTFNTNYIMDILSHSLNGVLDFQVKPGNSPIIYIALEKNSNLNKKLISDKLLELTDVKFEICFQKLENMKKKGLRNKYSHII